MFREILPPARPLLTLAALALSAAPAAAQDAMPATTPSTMPASMPSTGPATPPATGPAGLDAMTRPAALVANPAYAHWKQYRPGTTVTYQIENVVNGAPVTATMVQTLREVTPELAKIEMKVTVTMMGKSMDQPAQLAVVPAEVTPAEAQANDPTRAADPNAKTSKETLEVAGKSFDATVVQTTAVRNGVEMKIKAWTSDQIPGQLLKLQTSATGQANGTTQMTVVSFEAK